LSTIRDSIPGATARIGGYGDRPRDAHIREIASLKPVGYRDAQNRD
jgi:hypothetical protein